MFERETGVPMSQALTPKEQAHVRMFLRVLLTFAESCPEKKIDLSSFMREWRKLVSGKIKAGKNRNQWTEREEDLLLKLRRKGMSWEEIGKRLGRTAIACKGKFGELKR